MTGKSLLKVPKDYRNGPVSEVHLQASMVSRQLMHCKAGNIAPCELGLEGHAGLAKDGKDGKQAFVLCIR